MSETVALSTGLVDLIDWSAIRYRRRVHPSSTGDQGCDGVDVGLGRRTEDGLDERGEGFDGRADHQDVVFDEIGAGIIQQMEQRVAQDLHLAGRSEAGVELHGTVVRIGDGRHHPGRHWTGCRAAGDRGGRVGAGSAAGLTRSAPGRPPASASANSTAVSRCNRPHDRSEWLVRQHAVGSSARNRRSAVGRTGSGPTQVAGVEARRLEQEEMDVPSGGRPPRPGRGTRLRAKG